MSIFRSAMQRAVNWETAGNCSSSRLADWLEVVARLILASGFRVRTGCWPSTINVTMAQRPGLLICRKDRALISDEMARCMDKTLAVIAEHRPSSSGAMAQ